MVSRKAAAAFVGERCGHQWSHLWADSVEELIIFALSISLKESWIHRSKTCTHFDVVPSIRKKAISNGAIECSFKEWLVNNGRYGSVG
jgi:hypothetical protein